MDTTGAPASEDPEVGTAHRLAGLILILNGILVAVENTILADQLGGAMEGRHMLTGSLVDVGLGLALLAGAGSVLGFVKFRVIVGGIAFTALHFTQGDLLMAGLQVAFTVGLMLLLFGTAGIPRIAVGGLLVGVKKG